MEVLENKAIEAVNEFLIFLLKNQKYCEARVVGSALEILVNNKQRPIPNATAMEMQECQPERPSNRR